MVVFCELGILPGQFVNFPTQFGHILLQFRIVSLELLVLLCHLGHLNKKERTFSNTDVKRGTPTSRRAKKPKMGHKHSSKPKFKVFMQQHCYTVVMQMLRNSDVIGGSDVISASRYNGLYIHGGLLNIRQC